MYARVYFVCTRIHSVQPTDLAKRGTQEVRTFFPEQIILQMLLYILCLLFKYMRAYTPRGYVLCPVSRRFPTDVG